MENIIKKNKDLLTLKDYTKEEIENILELACEVKNNRNLYSDILKGKSFGLLFDKHSTRTRLSFEAGIFQLGGNAIYLDSKNLQINRGETYSDTAKIFSGYLDGIIIRTFHQETVDIFAKNADIPVINGLTDKYHPCQILADLFTLKEINLLNNDINFTYIGDSNNITNSLIIGFSKLGIGITVCSPEDLMPDKDIIEYANQISGKKLKLISKPVKAVENADIIYTDAWFSMGDKENDEKLLKLKNFQVNKKLLSYAKNDVKIMHCLPAHRGQEITSEVIDSTHSIVFRQAENRLHAQKALLIYLFKDFQR